MTDKKIKLEQLKWWEKLNNIMKEKMNTEPNEQIIKNEIILFIKKEIKNELEFFKNDCITEIKKIIPFTKKSWFSCWSWKKK